MKLHASYIAVTFANHLHVHTMCHSVLRVDNFTNAVIPQDKLSRSVNMRAMNMLGKAEEKVSAECLLSLILVSIGSRSHAVQ